MGALVPVLRDAEAARGQGADAGLALGRKDCTGNTHADWTCRACGHFNLSTKRDCERCGKPNPNANESAVSRNSDPDSRVGSAGGHFDRPDPEDQSARREYNSDDEEY